MKRRLYLVLFLLAVSPLLMLGAASRVNTTGGMVSLIGGATGAIVGMIVLVLLFYFLAVRPLGGRQTTTPGKSGLLVKKEDRKRGK